MHRILLFVEDFGHEEFIKTLLRRMAREQVIEVEIISRSATGGRGKMLTELEQFMNRLGRDPKSLPDLIIVATDGNCKKYLKRKQEVDQIIPQEIKSRTVCAIPDPHIERWLLLDSSAFRVALGKGCSKPPKKCERDRYKTMLIEAIQNTGRSPLIGGIEHAEAIVNSMDLDRMEREDKSLGKFLKDLQSKFREWSQKH
jgi:hypothetical protein